MVQALRTPQFDESGLLKNPQDWTADLARQLAANEGIEELTDQHWAFLNALREYSNGFTCRRQLQKSVISCTCSTAADIACLKPASPPGESRVCRIREKKRSPIFLRNDRWIHREERQDREGRMKQKQSPSAAQKTRKGRGVSTTRMHGCLIQAIRMP